MLHGCDVGDGTLVGMGAIVLNGAKIGKNSLVGAGSLVKERATFPDNSLIVGSPAKVVRTLPDDQAAGIGAGAADYVANSRKRATGVATPASRPARRGIPPPLAPRQVQGEPRPGAADLRWRPPGGAEDLRPLSCAPLEAGGPSSVVARPARLRLTKRGGSCRRRLL